MKKTILILITVAFLSSCNRESGVESTNIQISCVYGEAKNIKLVDSSNDFNVYYECRAYKRGFLYSIHHKKIKKIK